MLKVAINFLESLLMSVASLMSLIWLHLSLSAKERHEVKLFVDDLDAVHEGKYNYPKYTTGKLSPERQR